MENPPKSFNDSIALAGLSLGYMMRISQLQRALEIIKPKSYAKDGIISPKEETIIPKDIKPIDKLG